MHEFRESPRGSHESKPKDRELLGKKSYSIKEHPIQKEIPLPQEAPFNPPNAMMAHYAWSGELGDSTEAIDRYHKSTGVTSRRHFVNETNMTHAEREGMHRLHRAFTEIGEELGISEMQERLPDEAQHHLFPDKETYRAVLRQELKKSEESIAHNGGMQTATKGILFPRGKDPERTRYVLAHEDGHAISVQHVQVVDAPRPYKRMSGYQDLQKEPRIPGVPHGLTEATTNLYACTGLVRARYDIPTNPSYQPLNVVITALIKETAREHGIPPKVIADGLIKGALTLDRSGLQPLRESRNPEGMYMLENIKGGLTVDEAKWLARKLGLLFPFADLDRLAAKKQVKIFDWLQN